MANEPTVLIMTRETLQSEEYDGLYNTDGRCACSLEDLAPCGMLSGDCIFGVEVPCDCGDHDFHIVSKKEATNAK